MFTVRQAGEEQFVPTSGICINFLLNVFFFVDLRERERDINLLFHFLMHSLVDPFLCPDWMEPTTLAYPGDALTN